MQDNFKKYGYSFQIKLIAALFKDRLFLQQISDILKPSFMESEANQWIVEIILDYFTEFNALKIKCGFICSRKAFCSISSMFFSN